MSSVTGSITLNGGGGTNDPDGNLVSGGYGLPPSQDSFMNPYGGLSGIKAPLAGYLVGVFEGKLRRHLGGPPAAARFRGV